MTALRSISTMTSSPGTDLELSRILASLCAAMREGGHQAPLPPATRTRLEQRQAVLQASAVGATTDQTEIEVAKLMTAYPSSRAAALTDVQVTVRQYATALASVPLWALREVCADVLRGSVAGLNPDFMPTAPRMRQLVDDCMERSDMEARQIREVLDAPVVAPSDPRMAAATRKAIGEGLRNMADVMRDKDRSFAGPTGAEKAPFKPFSIAECAELYKSRPLPGMPARNGHRNDERNGDVTVRNDDHGAGL